MNLKFILFTFCLIQAYDLRKIVSAYPQPINSPKDDTAQQQQSKQQQQPNDGGNKETEVVEFQIQQNQNQVHVDDGQQQDDNGGGDDVCLEKKRVGPCKASIPKYYFDQGTSRCEIFLYGGCAGSKNRFDSLTDCEEKCATHLTRKQEPMALHTIGHGHDPTQVHISSPIICELPHTVLEGSSCQGYIPRWTYNTTEGKCVRFMYQGCGATKNNFQTKSSCEKACGEYKKITTTSTNVVAAANANLKSGTNTSCKLPMNSGPCYALYDRYYFNTVNSRCERFVFGGCGGNDNNFKTADECLRTCGGDEPAHDAACSEVTCPWSRYTHYTALGCKPIYDSNSCCPTRFDCPDSNLTVATQTEPKCRYQGNLYSIGEIIKDASSTKDCRASCSCVSLGVKARIQCVNIECPEQLGAVPPGKESCHRLYKKGGCCVDSYYCPSNDKEEEHTELSSSPQEQEPEKCHYEGKTYFAGERIYPEKSKCLKCLCKKGFNGNLTEEFCDKVDCGIEIYYADKLERGCVPVYLQDVNGVDNCCPISWKCPDEQKITLPVVPSAPNSQLQVPLPPVQPVPPVPGPITILPIPFGTTNTNSNINDNNLSITAITTGKSSKIIQPPLTISACVLPKVVGPCRAHRPRHFYNTATNKCENFTYGGCDGNQNNFVVLEDCERVCEENTNLILQELDDEEGGSTTARTTTQATHIMSRVGQFQIQPIPVQQHVPTAYKLTEIDPCEQSVQTGPCRAYLPRYYFSPRENACKFFVYGGCRGNENNFYSLTACEAKCQDRLPQESLQIQDVSQSSLSSNSNALRSSPSGDSSRVTFETSQEQPQQQRPPHQQRPTDFQIIDVTEPKTPKSICALRADTGRCKAHLRRYYFDGTRCVLFTYGGCGGNANNFRDLDECNLRCGGGGSGSASGSGSGIVQQQNFKTPKWRSAAGTQIQPVLNQQQQQHPVVFGGTERCQLPPKAGSCYGQFAAYYYDVVSRSCQSFTYGGCFGNTNRFVYLEECKATCERPLALERQNEFTLGRSGVSKGSDVVAHILPVDKPDDDGGDDDAVAHILPVDQPDVEDGPELTIHGRQLMPGEVIVIQPTDVQEQESKTEEVTTDVESQDDDALEEKVFCGLPAEKGPCKRHELRYFWDSNTQTCLPFYFGGCRGNKNNFLSESDCLSVCGAGPTLEQMTQDGILTCTFGNETFALGDTLGQFTSDGAGMEETQSQSQQSPCGVPICSCQTPPALTCIQKVCDRSAAAAHVVTLPRGDNNRSVDNVNSNVDSGRTSSSTSTIDNPEFGEIQRLSLPASTTSTSTPRWSKLVDKIVKW